jgi:hypothetical protein
VEKEFCSFHGLSYEPGSIGQESYKQILGLYESDPSILGEGVIAAKDLSREKFVFELSSSEDLLVVLCGHCHSYWPDSFESSLRDFPYKPTVKETWQLIRSYLPDVLFNYHVKGDRDENGHPDDPVVVWVTLLKLLLVPTSIYYASSLGSVFVCESTTPGSSLIHAGGVGFPAAGFLVNREKSSSSSNESMDVMSLLERMMNSLTEWLPRKTFWRPFLSTVTDKTMRKKHLQSILSNPTGVIKEEWLSWFSGRLTTITTLFPQDSDESIRAENVLVIILFLFSTLDHILDVYGWLFYPEINKKWFRAMGFENWEEEDAIASLDGKIQVDKILNQMRSLSRIVRIIQKRTKDNSTQDDY